MNRYKIAVIAGDGIGREVMPEGIRVLDAAARMHGFELDWQHFDWSCETYHATGSMMPADGIDQLSQHDSVFLGAVGFPGVPDHISLWGLLIPIRRASLFRWCLSQGMRVVKPMTLMSTGEYQEPRTAFLPSVQF